MLVVEIVNGYCWVCVVELWEWCGVIVLTVWCWRYSSRERQCLHKSACNVVFADVYWSTSYDVGVDAIESSKVRRLAQYELV